MCPTATAQKKRNKSMGGADMPSIAMTAWCSPSMADDRRS